MAVLRSLILCCFYVRSLELESCICYATTPSLDMGGYKVRGLLLSLGLPCFTKPPQEVKHETVEVSSWSLRDLDTSYESGLLESVVTNLKGHRSKSSIATIAYPTISRASRPNSYFIQQNMYMFLKVISIPSNALIILK